MLSRFGWTRTLSSESGFVSPLQKTSSFRSDIEGIRGIAVLLVVLYHAGVPGFTGGFIGVDVFFVLSGYLITGILVREVERSGNVDLWEFYARRVRRLLPAACVVLVATVLAGLFVYSPMEQARLARTAVATAAYMSNMWFAVRSADYFAAGTETDPLLHTWSLSVEEQFYVVWPVLVLLALRGGSRARLLAVMAGLSVFSLAGSLWLTETRQAWAFYGMPLRAWEFGLGGLASLLSVTAIRARPKASHALGWLGVFLIVGAAVGFSKNISFPGTAALVPVVGTLAVLLAGVGAPGRGIGRLLDAAPLQRMGQLSYSWYLWHWPVLVMTAAMVPGLTLLGRLICVAVAFALAAGTYALVENPIRHHRRLAPRPAYSLALAVVLTLASGSVAMGGRHSALQAENSPTHRLFFAAAEDRGQLGGCNASWGEVEAEPCKFGDPESPVKVVLFGDSHAEHWFAGLEIAAREQGWRLVTLTKSACPAAAIAFVDRRLHHPGECDEWRTNALDRIVELEPDVVVMGNAAEFYGATRDDWEAGFEESLGALYEADIPVLVLWGTPRAAENLPECLSRAVVRRRDPNTECSMDRPLASASASYLAARDIAAEMDRVLIGDVSDEFCEEATCWPIRQGAVVLYDNNHLTSAKSRKLAPVLTAFLREVLDLDDG